MNEEELFCKLFPEYAVNGKPLSPYFDLFESGYEQSENRIEELEKENAELNDFIMQSKKDGISPINALIIKNLDMQLTKAKKILKKFMPYVIESYLKQDISNIKLSFSEIEEAEQFLNSEVEK